MDTAQENLFRAMMTHGWFTATDGDSDSPYGFFGYVVNEAEDLPELYAAFSEEIAVYGKPSDDEVIGMWVAWLNAEGVMTIRRAPSIEMAAQKFDRMSKNYVYWIEQIS